MIGFGKNDKTTNSISPFLIRLEEGEDNCVKFVIATSWLGEKGTGIDDVDIEGIKSLIDKSYPIYPNYEDIYQITFEGYILYQTRNESFCSWDDYEVSEGKNFIVFSKSRMLDYLSQITDCQQLEDGTFYPGEWKHYGIYCQNHIIDIISSYEPIIEKLRFGGSEN